MTNQHIPPLYFTLSSDIFHIPRQGQYDFISSLQFSPQEL